MNGMDYRCDHHPQLVGSDGVTLIFIIIIIIIVPWTRYLPNLLTSRDERCEPPFPARNAK
jgi:hypothetical protein